MPPPLLQPVISPVIVGRDEHLAALDALVARARAGAGLTLLVSGEAGVGKSRLVAETRARFGGPAIHGACFEHDLALPYAPYIDMLRDLVARRPAEIDRLTSSAPELLALLPELTGRDEQSTAEARDPEQEKRRVFAALPRLIDGLAADAPLLVVIEDIHWADDLSLELTHRLAQRVAGRPILLLLTWRSDEVSRQLEHLLAAIDRGRLGAELRLDRLAPPDVGDMLRAIFDQSQPIRADFLRAIVDLTDGNPFFIEEVLSALIAAGDIYRANGGWTRKELTDLRVPRSVLDAVQQRSRALSARARHALDVAAVAGQRFDFDTLREVLGATDACLLAWLREAIDARLLVEVSADQFAFRHALTREAVYQRLLARERRGLHLAIGATIERLRGERLEPWHNDLSYHFHAAEAWEQTYQYARLAGDRSRALYSPSAEIVHVGRALAAAEQLGLPTPRDLIRRSALARVTLGQFDAAERDHALALDLARQNADRRAECQSLLDLGALWSGRDYERAGAWFERALALARTLDDPLAVARSLVQIGNWQVNRERPAEARQSLTDALAIFEAAGARDEIAETIDLLGIVADIAADVAQMNARLDQAIGLYRASGNRHGLASALATRCCGISATVFDAAVVPVGETHQFAANLLDESLAICRDIGWRSGEAYALLNAAYLARQAGDTGRALELTEASLAIAAEIEHHEWMSLAHNAFSSLRSDLIDYAAAREHAERALICAHASGSLHFVDTSAGCLIDTCVADGALDRAAAVSAEFDPDLPLETTGQRRLWLARGNLALAAGAAADALAIAERLLATATGLVDQGDIPDVARLRGEALARLGDAAEAERALLAAASGARARNLTPLQFRIQTALATLHARQGHHADAARAWAEAGRITHTIAASLTDDSQRQTYLERANALAPPLADVSEGGLTRRERDVALLVARGCSNREIAGELFVGERTVETHVGNILAKLGFASRAQIAVWAVETGLAARA